MELRAHSKMDLIAFLNMWTLNISAEQTDILLNDKNSALQNKTPLSKA